MRWDISELSGFFIGWWSAVISVSLIFLENVLQWKLSPCPPVRAQKYSHQRPSKATKKTPLSKQVIVLYLNIESSIVPLSASLRSWHFSGLKGPWCAGVCKVFFSIRLFGESWWQCYPSIWNVLNGHLIEIKHLVMIASLCIKKPLNSSLCYLLEHPKPLFSFVFYR